MASRPAVDTPLALLLGSASVFFLIHTACAYDPLDPNGHITIRWDVMAWRDDLSGYDAAVTIFNNQQYRHIEKPGWKLSWIWPNDEVIWNMMGAEATEQGNCSRMRASQLPHCCDKKPVIIDLLPGSPYNVQTANCCRGGVLSSLRQNPSKSASSFQLTVGNMQITNGSDNDLGILSDPYGNFIPGFNFSLGTPGYTCGELVKVAPTKLPVDGGRRRIQALATFRTVCSYSQMVAKPVPTCCVSLSTFYNSTIVGCPYCSCGCEGSPTQPSCLKEGQQPPVLQLPGGEAPQQPVLRCTSHMCPIAVHWHVKTSYKGYWRVKMTVTNFNLFQNYSEWNLVVQHPNLGNLTTVFSFMYQPLNVYPGNNDSGVFWGIPFYNDLLLQYGDDGNVQTEMLMQKEPGEFTFQAGWAFPRKIYFNGDLCVMPQPDAYPLLPKSVSGTATRGVVYHRPALLLTLICMLW